MTYYLIHKGISDWIKPNHKYIHRYRKNGRWYYVYKSGKAYNWLQAITGAGERDAYNTAKKEYKESQNNLNILTYKVSPNKNKITDYFDNNSSNSKNNRDRAARNLARKNKYRNDVSKHSKAKEKYQEALKDYQTTPLYKLSQTSRKIAKAKNYILTKLHIKAKKNQTSSSR